MSGPVVEVRVVRDGDRSVRPEGGVVLDAEDARSKSGLEQGLGDVEIHAVDVGEIDRDSDRERRHASRERARA